MAPFHVRRKVCIALFHVRIEVCKFALHMDESNADFAPHMEGRHADFAPHMEQRHSFRDQKIAKTAISANFQRELLKTTNIAGVYMTLVTTFENKNFLRESTFHTIKREAFFIITGINIFTLGRITPSLCTRAFFVM